MGKLDGKELQHIREFIYLCPKVIKTTRNPKAPTVQKFKSIRQWKFLNAVEIWQSFQPALASHNCQKFITFGEPKSNWLATRYLERYSLPQCSDCILILFTKWNKPIFILQRRKVWFGCQKVWSLIDCSDISTNSNSAIFRDDTFEGIIIISLYFLSDPYFLRFLVCTKSKIAGHHSCVAFLFAQFGNIF